MNHSASVSVQQIRWLEQSAKQTGNTEHKILYWLFIFLTGFYSDTTKRLEALEAVLLPKPADPPASATGDLSSAAAAILDAYRRSPSLSPAEDRLTVAAVIKALADQVVPYGPCGDDCCVTQAKQIRAKIHTIAAELERVGND